MPYRGPIYSDFSSDSDIPVVGKGWWKRGRTFKGGDASTSSDDSSDFQEKKRHKPQPKIATIRRGAHFRLLGWPTGEAGLEHTGLPSQHIWKLR